MKVSAVKINVDNVMKVYRGKAHTCMCGCSGKYRVAKAHVEKANKDRPSCPYTKRDISDEFVREVCTVIEQATDVDNENGYVAVVVDDKTYAAYFVPDPTARNVVVVAR